MPPSDRSQHQTTDRSQPPFTVPSPSAGSKSKFLVRESHLPVGDDYVIELDPGDRVYDVDGQFLRVRESLTIKNIDGDEVLHIQGTLLDVKRVLNILRQGAAVATVRKQTPETGPDVYVVELPEDERVEVRGDPSSRKYELSYRDSVVAKISRAWIPLSKGYRVQVAPGQDGAVV